MEVEEMEREGVLGDKVKACLEGGSEDFLPPLRSPKPEEYVQVRSHATFLHLQTLVLLSTLCSVYT